MKFEFNIDVDDDKLQADVDQLMKNKIDKAIVNYINSYDFDRKFGKVVNDIMTSEHLKEMIIEELKDSKAMKEKIQQTIIKKLTIQINKLMVE